MGYFITGATGFIGRHLVVELAARGEPISILVRPESRDKFDRLVSECGPAGKLLAPIGGDLANPLLGISEPQRRALRGHIKHFFHLGALYDLNATDADLVRANVLGTRNALDLAQDIDAGCFHFVSSIAAAGRFRGTFTEGMFERSARPGSACIFAPSTSPRGLVRSSCKVPWRIYRPGMVVGHSRSGVIDKIDGPYYLFKLIQRLRDCLPRWVPLVGIEGGHINLVPVDFVAAAMVHLAHVPQRDGECFHLTDPKDWRLGDVLNVFARAAHAPTMMLRFDAGAGQFLAEYHTAGVGAAAVSETHRGAAVR